MNESPKLTQKYGDIIRLSRKRYLITGPKAFKQILFDQPELFTKKNSTYERIKHLFGEGLIVSEPPIWDLHRPALHKFFQGDRVNQYYGIMRDCTEEMLTRWRQPSCQKSIDIVQEMTYLTLKIAFKAFSSHTPSVYELKMINQSILKGTPHISHALFLSRWIPTFRNLRFFWTMDRISQILKKILQQKKNHGSASGDYVDLLLSLQKNPQGHAFNDSEVLDEFKTILLTGHETTACGLAWVWQLLNQYPHYLPMLRQELQKVVGDAAIPNLAQCNQLPLTKAVFLEALRLYPPIWCLPRTTHEKTVLCGYEIPANSQLILNVQALHRNPHYWEQPNVFYPERFLGHSDRQRTTNTFLPFSIGKHSCIGSHFALLEGVLLIAMIVQGFQLKALYNPHKITAMPLLSLRPPKKLMMQPKPR